MDVRRRDEPPHGRVDDPDPDEDEGDSIRKGREDLDAPEAEGPAPARRASRYRGGDESERKGGRVGEHVPCVGKQRQRARGEPDNDLGDEQPDDESKRSGQHPPIAGMIVLVPRHGLDRSPPPQFAARSRAQ